MPNSKSFVPWFMLLLQNDPRSGGHVKPQFANSNPNRALDPSSNGATMVARSDTASRQSVTARFQFWKPLLTVHFILAVFNLPVTPRAGLFR